MHTGEATFFLASFTLFKLVVNGVNAKPRATTGFARKEDRSEGNLALIWLGERHTCALCTPQANLAEFLTPGASVELNRAWNSATFGPTPSATDADTAMATGDVTRVRWCAGRGCNSVKKEKLRDPQNFLNLSISPSPASHLLPPSELALLRPGAGGVAARDSRHRPGPVPNLRSTEYRTVAVANFPRRARIWVWPGPRF